MNSNPPDLRDPEIDGFTKSAMATKRRVVSARTLILAAVAILSLGWGAVSVCSFVRTERAADWRQAQPVVEPERPLFGAKIDPEHFEQIRTGMKLEDVEKVLGGPPGWYETLAAFTWEREPRLWRKGSHTFDWFGTTACITILLDDSDTVIDKDYCPGHRQTL
jgi:hypothetical protein